jgi:hypothetical protein
MQSKAEGATPGILRFVDSGNPSEVTNAAWIVANYSGKMEKATPRTGKWLMFIAEKYIDDTWKNVRNAIESGKLWKTAKVSTAWGSKGNIYVLCVYPYDHEDAKDVARVREELRELGFKRQISYKTDEQTEAGVYSDVTVGVAKYKS